MPDYYRTLQVTREAEPEVIERAYKALSRKYHPDRNPSADSQSAGSRMRQLNEAYAMLKDPEKRRAYDRTLVPEEARAWDVFWERGLVGMYQDRFRRRSGTDAS